MSTTVYGQEHTRRRHVVEIGAGDSYSSEGLRWATHADKVSLYEPNLVLWADLRSAAAGFLNVEVHQCAISAARAPLVHLGYASYLLGKPSFFRLGIEENGQAALNPEQWVLPLARPVSVLPITEVDDGSWDLLYLTCNGSEMDILPGMKSRPARIYTKHYCHNEAQWREFGAVQQWMTSAGYQPQVLERNTHGTFHAVCWKREGAT